MVLLRVSVALISLILWVMRGRMVVCGRFLPFLVSKSRFINFFLVFYFFDI
nr:MAG TPA: hypothetical protein [Bacteriophage sp.]